MHKRCRRKLVSERLSSQLQNNVSRHYEIEMIQFQGDSDKPYVKVQEVIFLHAQAGFTQGLKLSAAPLFFSSPVPSRFP